MSSVPFLGATTMEAHHSVEYDTGVILPCSSKLWSFVFSFSLYAYSPGGLEAEWLRVVYEGYVKLLSFHGFYLVIEYTWELVDKFCEVACWVISDDVIVWTLMCCG